MVHVGADVRRVPRACAGGRRTDLFLHAALRAGWVGQRHLLPAAEGQAWQPLQRVIGSGIRKCLCAAARRRGTRGSDNHPNGLADPAGLFAGLCGADAFGARACASSRAQSQRVPEASCRSAADAQRARRHGAACGSFDRAGDAALQIVRPRPR